MPMLVSRRCTRMPSGIPTSVKPKHANEKATCRFSSTRMGSVKSFRFSGVASCARSWTELVAGRRRQV